MKIIKKIIDRYNSKTPKQLKITARILLTIAGNLGGHTLHENCLSAVSIILSGIALYLLLNLATEENKNEKSDK